MRIKCNGAHGAAVVRRVMDEGLGNVKLDRRCDLPGYKVVEAYRGMVWLLVRGRKDCSRGGTAITSRGSLDVAR